MKRAILNTRNARNGILGLLAGASLMALVLGAPSYAIDPTANPAPTAAPAPVSTPLSQPSANLADLVERVSPSVVQIMVRQASPMQRVAGPEGFPGTFDGLPPELRDFFGRDLRSFGGRPGLPRPMPDRLGSGSGFFVEGGYIVTNNHVVDNARKLQVRLDSGEEVEGTLVGTDAKTDLAVLKVDAKHARKALSWGDSSRSRAGDNVFTIGAPFSLGNTVTAGIISARGRDIGSGPYDDYLQIDAPINPGNSGGPMFNAAGEVIGVNTAIYSPSGGNVGIGFSIPAEQAKQVVQQIIDRGYVERGWLGVNVQSVTPEIAQSFGRADAKGVLVSEVTVDSPAARAGLKPMDLILAYDGRPIAAMHDLTRAVAETKPGTIKPLTIARDGGERTLSVKIAALVAPVARQTEAPGSQTPLNDGVGLAVVESADGLVIADLAPDSLAREAGLRVGDRLLAVGATKVKTAKDAQGAIREARAKGRKAVLVQIERDNTELFVGVPLAQS